MYRDWRGIVYPQELRQREWFGYYATLFDTVEINNTFYRLPPPSTVEAWAGQAPEGFEYALKLGQFGSHRMKLRDAVTWLPNHLDRVERLGPHLGPNLVQLPPRWKRNVERLDEFLTGAPKTIPRAGGPRRFPQGRPQDDPLGGRAARPDVGARRRVLGARTARRRAVHPRPATRPPLGAHDRLDLRPLPRAAGAREEVLRPLRRSSALAGRRSARRVDGRGLRGPRVLQQRLGRARRCRRAVARPPPRL